MVGRVRYYPYGGIRDPEGTIPTDKLFTGQQQETTSGVYHYNARLYDADIGRFPQADTIAYDRYGYAGNNPVNFTDPSGQWYKYFQSGWKTFGGKEDCQSYICTGSGWYWVNDLSGDQRSPYLQRDASIRARIFGWIWSSGTKGYVDVGVQICRSPMSNGTCNNPRITWWGYARALRYPPNVCYSTAIPPWESLYLSGWKFLTRGRQVAPHGPSLYPAAYASVQFTTTLKIEPKAMEVTLHVLDTQYNSGQGTIRYVIGGGTYSCNTWLGGWKKSCGNWYKER